MRASFGAVLDRKVASVVSGLTSTRLQKADDGATSPDGSARAVTRMYGVAPTTAVALPCVVTKLRSVAFGTIWRLRGETGVHASATLVRRATESAVVITYGPETLLEEVFPTEDDALERALQIESRLLERGWVAF